MSRFIENKHIKLKWPFYAANPACKHTAGNRDGKYLLNNCIGGYVFELVLVFLPETFITIDQRDSYTGISKNIP